MLLDLLVEDLQLPVTVKYLLDMMPFGGKRESVFLHKFVVDDFLRRLDGHEEASPDQRVLLGLALPVLPALLVGAGQEVLPHLALGQDRVPAHAVHEALQLVHPVLDELLLVAT